MLMLLVSVPTWAQLYSSGNNTITGSWVGIRQSTPQGSLHIRETPGINAGTPFATYHPLLRLQSQSTTVSPVQNYYWDLRMDGGSGLTFWTQKNTDPATPALILQDDYVRTFTKYRVADDGEFGQGTAPDGSQGYFLSLGMRELTSGVWNGAGAGIFSTASGLLQFMTNSAGGVVNGASAMNAKVVMTLEDGKVRTLAPLHTEGLTYFEDDVYAQAAFHAQDVIHADQGLISEGQIRSKFNVAIEIPVLPGGGSGEGALIYHDDNLNGVAFNQLFKIKAFGLGHPNAPNTLQIENVGNGGNLHLALPVRIGGAYDDMNIITNDYQLYVAHGIRTERVKVDYYGDWPDFVFGEEYELRSFDELRSFIDAENHLPGIPSAKEVEENGVELGEMNAALLQKVEELTLYILQLEQRLQQVETCEASAAK